MKKRFTRTPKHYDGVVPTSHRLHTILHHYKEKLKERKSWGVKEILESWPSLIGPHLAPMTQAVSFHEGILTVFVKNSSLYSLLSQHEKPRLLRELRNRFPSASIRALWFRIGSFNE